LGTSHFSAILIVFCCFCNQAIDGAPMTLVANRRPTLVFDGKVWNKQVNVIFLKFLGGSFKDAEVQRCLQ
jgi:hypothetical protein